MCEFINVIAVDRNSSDTIGRNFPVADPKKLKTLVSEWEKEIPYNKYELTTTDFIEDYNEEIQEVLDVLEIEN